MPKSKRARVMHTSSVTKKTREHKERLFENVRECIPKYQHCFVLTVDNMRNTYLKDVRQELSDSRLFFGKTKLMARALGHSPEDSQADNLYQLTPYLKGAVGLLFTDRAPPALLAYLGELSQVDFARAGVAATREFVIPRGVVMSTGGEVPAEYDVAMGHTIEPELRRLGVPTRMVKGKIVLEEAPDGASDDEKRGYVVCRAGDILDSRQTRLLKLFSVCMAEFRVHVLAYWSAASTEVTKVEANPAGASGDLEGLDDE
ncbi:ribosomal protein L10-domain-containing protein [Hypoxylon argillaceum]|nr:ribosomal protein L10-domain-containing protein [Hypoxylon argillaceum]KAI1148668.1 ribosomal protein L10-domain-containing protein [Nemania diffusa]